MVTPLVGKLDLGSWWEYGGNWIIAASIFPQTNPLTQWYPNNTWLDLLIHITFSSYLWFHIEYLNMEVSRNGGSHKWMAYMGKSDQNGWWTGVPPFMDTPHMKYDEIMISQLSIGFLYGRILWSEDNVGFTFTGGNGYRHLFPINCHCLNGGKFPAIITRSWNIHHKKMICFGGTLPSVWPLYFFREIFNCHVRMPEGMFLKLESDPCQVGKIMR